jgi:hypothetical protein
MSWLKSFLVIFAKNAVNSVIVNSGLVLMIHNVFNTYSKSGLYNLGKATIATIVAREVVVWGPVVYAWSTTNASPSDLDCKLQIAQDASQLAAKQADKAVDAVADAKNTAAKEIH